MEIIEVIQSDILKTWINPEILDLEVLESYRTSFQNALPFKHLYIDEIIASNKFDELTDELAEQEFEFKESDLFQLAQTPDIDNLDSELLIEFKSMLRSSEFLSVMEYITGVSLSSDVDCIGNIYQDTDYLLCHDDKLVKRKIAYILYFTELTEEEGGALHIFDTRSDNTSVPGNIVKKIYPKRNRLTFFQVTRQSFHEVGEIIGENVFRVSLSGWFNNSEN